MRELMEYIEQWKQDRAASILGRVETELDMLTSAVERVIEVTPVVVVEMEEEKRG